MDYSLILFFSSNYAIFGKKLLQQKGLEAKLRPVPRVLSSNCGICTRIRAEEEELARNILSTKAVPFMKIVAEP